MVGFGFLYGFSIADYDKVLGSEKLASVFSSNEWNTTGI